jgi:intein-encoded DNA endonuclease-like protein
MFANIFNNPEAYAYILGLYLADGVVTNNPRTKRLRISLHSENDLRVIEKCIHNLKLLFPENKTTPHKRTKSKCVDVSLYNSKLNEYFPQCGVGPKHTRKLELVNWQKEIIHSNLKDFLAGLFDGDGSFYMNRKRNVMCAQFTNKSQDILQWCKSGLDSIGIEYCETYPKSKNGTGVLLIQNQVDVEKLTNFLT